MNNTKPVWSAEILTVSGKHFNFEHPEDSEYTVEDIQDYMIHEE